MKHGDLLENLLPSETLLQDDYPVHHDYLYIVDGKVFRSDVKGNVVILKRDLLSQNLIASMNVEVRRFDHSRFNS
jgi:hypothetical protein